MKRFDKFFLCICDWLLNLLAYLLGLLHPSAENWKFKVNIKNAKAVSLMCSHLIKKT